MAEAGKGSSKLYAASANRNTGPPEWSHEVGLWRALCLLEAPGFPRNYTWAVPSSFSARSSDG